MRGIVKEFPGVRALDGVDFDVNAGEVHALIGENGAGKSTLTRIIVGDYPPDEGDLSVSGTSVHFASPRDSIAAGIRLVTQERTLVESLSVAENVLMGDLPTRGWLPVVDRGTAERRTRAATELVGLSVDPWTEVGLLKPAEQQLVEIARALSRDATLLVLDEPTAALSADESERLFSVIKSVRARGTGVVYISHRVGELASVADRVTVLRDGRVVASHLSRDVTTQTLIREIVGRDIGEIYPERSEAFGDVLLTLTNLTVPGSYQSVNLSVRRGEIVAIFGLIGSGATELPYVAAAPTRASRSAVDQHGTVGLVPADRRSEGVLPTSTLQRNIGASTLGRASRWGIFRRSMERSAALRQIERLHIRPPFPDAMAVTLSGGNQQKAILGRCLERGSDLLLMSEPTRGVDMGARAEIYATLSDLCGQGMGILLASSDLDEVVGLADRAFVMVKGSIVASFEAPMSADALLEAATA